MKNILQKLEKSHFINDIHKKVLWADTVSFAKFLKSKPKSLSLLKSYIPEDIAVGDLRIKFNLMTSGFYSYVAELTTADADEIMLSCNMPDGILLIAYKNAKNTRNVVDYLFSYTKSVPIHHNIINLDFKNKVHILLYNLRLEFPGFSTN